MTLGNIKPKLTEFLGGKISQNKIIVRYFDTCPSKVEKNIKDTETLQNKIINIDDIIYL